MSNRVSDVQLSDDLIKFLNTLDEALSYCRFSIPIRREFMRFIDQHKLDLVRGHYETSTRMDEMTEKLASEIEVATPENHPVRAEVEIPSSDDNEVSVEGDSDKNIEIPNSDKDEGDENDDTIRIQ